MYLGSAYYPEHISPEQVALDASLMQKAGCSLVRMGEFAWCFMEPDDGRFDFTWLDSAIETLAHHGVKTLLCTPTASPPKWLMDKHPDIYQTTESGTQREWGARREYCVNNRNYHFYTERIVTALAEHYRDNPNVIGYQLDNEFMAERPYCYCPTCESDFRTWLREKYGTIQIFNRRCGTAFWGLSYRHWDEISMPKQNQNPSLVLEMYRFFSDAFLKYAQLQTDILHRLSPGKTVMHNICSSGFVANLDLYKLGKVVDIAGLDNYPQGWTLETELRNHASIPYNPAMASLALAYTRAVQKGPFWVTEKQICPGGGPLLPGFPRMWTAQELAHGGRMFLFFPWRACPYGVENKHLGIIDYDSVPRRRYFEVQRIASELAALPEEVTAAQPKAEAALLRDFDCDWALMADTCGSEHRYQRHLLRYSQALFRNQVNYDIVSPQDDWSAYRLLIVPALLLVNETLAAKLEAYARGGGTLILTFLSGLRDSESVFISETFPGKLRALCGLEIEEQDNQFQYGKPAIRLLDESYAHNSANCDWWRDVLKLTTARTLAVYADAGQYTGTPAITENRFGDGRVFYMGTLPEDAFLEEFIGKLTAQCGIERPITCASPMVEVVHTQGDAAKFAHILNFSQEPQVVVLKRPYVLLNNGEKAGNEITIPPVDYVILKTKA